VLRLEQAGIQVSHPRSTRSSVFVNHRQSKACRHGQLSPNQLFPSHHSVPESGSLCRIYAWRAKARFVQAPAPESTIQHWFFEQDFSTYHHWNQACLMVKQVLDMAFVVSAWASHPTPLTPFASVFTSPTDAGYQQSSRISVGAALVTHVDLADLPPSGRPGQRHYYSSGRCSDQPEYLHRSS